MNQESGKGIIFGVLGILTLIIAIMGASLAYFTASGMSAEEPIEVTAATVTITYIQGEVLRANELIPSTKDVAVWAYNREASADGQPQQCKDSKGYQVCSVFRFAASNEAGRNDQKIVGTITTTTDTASLGQEAEFENLAYTIFYIDAEGDRVEINNNLTKLAKSGGKTQLFTRDETDEYGVNEFIIEAGSIYNFEVLVWLNEKSTDLENDTGEGNQDFEQGLSYSGLVEIAISNASDKVTGSAE